MKQGSVVLSITVMLLFVSLFDSYRSGKLMRETPTLFVYHSSHRSGPPTSYKDYGEIDATTGYLVIDSSDSDRDRKIMYNYILLALDSVHQICDDPRIDSVYRFIRPRMRYTPNLNDGVKGQSPAGDTIWVMPLRTGEDNLTFVERTGEIENALGVYSEDGGGKSITMFEMDRLSFVAMATVFLHEARHATNHVAGFSSDSEEGDEIEHAEIFTLECSIVAAFMEKDSVLRKCYEGTSFDNSTTCRMVEGNKLLNDGLGTGLFTCWLHGIWFMKTSGTPKTEQERLDLYRKANTSHNCDVVASL